MNSTQVKYLFIRLLNFKIDNTSIRLFDGVDYTEMKKKREQELKELMLNEMSVSISRRSKRNIQSTDDPNEIDATEDVTTFTFAPASQDPNANPQDPNIPQETEQPAWEYRPTTEPVTEPPTDDGDDEEDNSNNNNNGNGNGNGNGFWNPGN